MAKSKSNDAFDPQRWGVPSEAVKDLGKRLRRFWQRFRKCFRTQTRDGSEHAYSYLRGQLTMDAKRNFAQIAQQITGEDGQALQHFMSNSPWDERAVLAQIHSDLIAEATLAQGSILVLDESADEKGSQDSAGAARQHNGRMGKTDMCQVGVYLAYANPAQGLWTLVDGELFLPEAWCGPDFQTRRKRLGLPAEPKFATKPQLGLRMILRMQQLGLPFECVACDTLYGRNREFRLGLDDAQIRYAAEIPEHTRVYLDLPVAGVPARKTSRGKTPRLPKVLNQARSLPVRELAHSPELDWSLVRVRPTEQGWLEAHFAVRAIWTWSKEHGVRAEWLVIRRNLDGELTYTLLNAPSDAAAAQLIAQSCQRYFIEQLNREAKTELGMAEFQAQSYRAWQHHLALTALTCWFIAQTKLEWRRAYTRDPQLLTQFELEILPALSTANVRELLKSALPLPRLSTAAATELVVHHLVNRARSTQSRLRAQQPPPDSS
jgi:SRSO17 transposase